MLCHWIPYLSMMRPSPRVAKRKTLEEEEGVAHVLWTEDGDEEAEGVDEAAINTEGWYVGR